MGNPIVFTLIMKSTYPPPKILINPSSILKLDFVKVRVLPIKRFVLQPIEDSVSIIKSRIQKMNNELIRETL